LAELRRLYHHVPVVRSAYLLVTRLHSASSSREQPALRIRRFDPLAGYVEIFALDLDANELASKIRARHARRPRPHERIKHHLAGKGCTIHQPLRLSNRLRARMPVLLCWLRTAKPCWTPTSPRREIGTFP